MAFGCLLVLALFSCVLAEETKIYFVEKFEGGFSLFTFLLQEVAPTQYS